ncbi:unnamed protein product [Musa hybrid cultivar]
MGNYGVKRKKAEGSDVDEQETWDNKKTKKGMTLPLMIKNKEKRSTVHAKLKHKKKIEKRKQAKAREATINRALDLDEEPLEKKVPQTIENTREVDETVCRPDDEEIQICITVPLNQIYDSGLFGPKPDGSLVALLILLHQWRGSILR